MNKDVQLNIERFDQELEGYRLLVIKNKEILKDNPWLDSQITFWMETTRFLIAEVQIWDQMGNSIKCEEVTVRVQKSLNRLFRLTEQIKNLK